MSDNLPGLSRRVDEAQDFRAALLLTIRTKTVSACTQALKRNKLGELWVER
jgi:hypothetical protein